MAHLDTIPNEVLVSVAREIGNLINTGFKESTPREAEATTAEESGLEIAETITVWKFQDRALETLATSTLSGDLSEWIEKPPLSLHHQIRLQGRIEGFARSDPKTDKAEEMVLEISTSEFAASLNESFEIIEQYKEDRFLARDPVVRLLEIPPYHVFALWLFLEGESESRVSIVTAPDGYEEWGNGKIVDSRTFFDALKSNGPVLDIA